MAPSRAPQRWLRLASHCARLQPIQRRGLASSGILHNEGTNLPRVADPSLWRSLIPKFLRRDGASIESPRSKEWHPATIFIVLGILVGSNAINILALRREMLNFSRKTEAKLTVLREVLQRVKNGEDVDVENMLGTGDPKQEREWAEMIDEIEEADMLAEAKRKREAKAAAKTATTEAEKGQAQDHNANDADHNAEAEGSEGSKARRPRFMM